MCHVLTSVPFGCFACGGVERNKQADRGPAVSHPWRFLHISLDSQQRPSNNINYPLSGNVDINQAMQLVCCCQTMSFPRGCDLVVCLYHNRLYSQMSQRQVPLFVCRHALSLQVCSQHQKGTCLLSGTFIL